MSWEAEDKNTRPGDQENGIPQALSLKEELRESIRQHCEVRSQRP